MDAIIILFQEVEFNLFFYGKEKKLVIVVLEDQKKILIEFIKKFFRKKKELKFIIKNNCCSWENLHFDDFSNFNFIKKIRKHKLKITNVDIY